MIPQNLSFEQPFIGALLRSKPKPVAEELSGPQLEMDPRSSVVQPEAADDRMIGSLGELDEVMARQHESQRLTLSAHRRPASLRKLPKELTQSSKRILGENGVRRFHEFRGYPPRWDSGRGRSLSSGSVIALNSFLSRFQLTSLTEPSLFLTYDGNLQLGWEDAEKGVVELEFFPDRVEYFIESLDEEGVMRLGSQAQVVEKIESILR